LGRVYQEKGDYAKSEPLLSEALEILVKTVGKEHPSYYLVCLKNLAFLYHEKPDFIKAESLLLEARETLVKVLDPEQLNVSNSAYLLAILYQETNRPSKAATFFLENNELNRRLDERSNDYASESQMLAYLNKFEGENAQFQSFARVNPSPELITGQHPTGKEDGILTA
jgi:tetratricopeptide (TPR) repeat protein